MKHLLLTLTFLLTFTLRGLALVEIERVTPASAEKYGIKIETRQANPHQTGVWLTFKTDGALKGFTSVQCSIAQGDHNLVALSLATEVKDGVATAMFNVNPSLLQDSRLMILKRSGGRSNEGYTIHIKDFLPADATKVPKGKATAPAPAPDKPQGGN